MTINRRTVIVADDSGITVMLYSLLVERMGFNVIPAGNGLEVLKILHQNVPDGILLDLNMPVMDGRTTLRHIRQDPRTASVPVIVVTVESSAQARYDCLRLGCSEFLSKPVKLSKLHEALQACLKDRAKVRKRMRAPLHGPVRVTVDGACMDMDALNVSERGIFLQTSSPFSPGTELSVSLIFDGGVEHAFGGVVVRRQEGARSTGGETPVGMAVEFTDVLDEAAVALRNLVHRQLLADLDGNGRSDLVHPEPDFSSGTRLPLTGSGRQNLT